MKIIQENFDKYFNPPDPKPRAKSRYTIKGI